MKEVIILGMGQTSPQCPYDGEIWGVNRGFKKARRIDRLFMSDTRKDAFGDERFDWDNLKKFKFPIISLHSFKEVKTVRYPYKQIVKRFKTEFFTCTICYMIAYALYKGYDKIRMYGVDMITTNEYKMEKGGVEFWVGIAKGMGVDVEISKGSAVCQTMTGVPYGFKLKVDKRLIAEWKKLNKRSKKMKEPIIVGEEKLDRHYVEELKEWSEKNDEKREKEKKQRKAYKTIPAIDAYKAMKDRRAYEKKKKETGHGRVFSGFG